MFGNNVDYTFGNPPAVAGTGSIVAGRLVSNFLAHRLDQMTANEPDIVGRLNGATSSGQPVNVAAAGDDTSSQIAFSTSLRQMATGRDKAADLPPAMALGHNSGRRSPQIVTSPGGFDIWAEGTFGRYDFDFADSDLALVYVGAEYRSSPWLLVGVLGQYDRSEESDKTVRGEIEGDGWMVGPYVVARLHEHVLFDGRAAWGQSDNDVRLGTASGSFDTDRWLVKGQLTSDFKSGGYTFAPHVAVIVAEHEQDAFFLSRGGLVAGQSARIGRLTFGPKVSTSYIIGSGMALSPYAAVKGIWDFDGENTVNVTNGLVVAADEVRARVELGAAITTDGGLSVAGEAFYDGIGSSDVEGYGGTAKVNVPLN